MTKLEAQILGGTCVAFGWAFLFVHSPVWALGFMAAAAVLLLWAGPPDHDDTDPGGPLGLA